MKKESRKVYLSVEWFGFLPLGPDYFLVRDITRALEVPGDFFHLDFSTVPPERGLRSLPLGEGSSIVQCYLLTPNRGLISLLRGCRAFFLGICGINYFFAHFGMKGAYSSDG